MSESVLVAAPNLASAAGWWWIYKQCTSQSAIPLQSVNRAVYVSRVPANTVELVYATREDQVDNVQEGRMGLEG